MDLREYNNKLGVNFAKDMKDPLFKAILEGDERKAIYLLKHGWANPNKKYWRNITALMIAAEKGYCKIVDILISKGAEVNAQDEDGCTALMDAARKGNNDVKLLIQKRADVNKKGSDGTTALMYAAEYCDKDVVNELITHGAEVNVQNNKDWTALMKAAKAGNEDVVKLLIDKGADVNTRDRHGTTTLM